MRNRHQGTVVVRLPVSPGAIWAVLTDPARIGEWSGECRSGRWLDGATGPTVGGRFVGRNRLRWIGWTRACRILELERPSRFVFETISPSDCTRWTYQLTAVGPETEVRQSFEIRRMWPVLALLINLLIPEHFDRGTALRDDLYRLGQVAAAE